LQLDNYFFYDNIIAIQFAKHEHKLANLYILDRLFKNIIAY